MNSPSSFARKDGRRSRSYLWRYLRRSSSINFVSARPLRAQFSPKQLCADAIVIARSYSEDLDVVLASRFSRSLSPDFVKNDATLNNLAYGPRIV